MFNSIYPININYRKPQYQANNANNDTGKSAQNNQSNQPRSDVYTPQSNKINISQILLDFKNTILAINAPKEVQDEVGIYLGLVEKESEKEIPSRDIILSNLRNASKVSDSYIASALGKQSNVVEGWITTVFRQDIDLKANPNDVNPDFLLKFPQKAQGKIVSQQPEQIQEQQTQHPIQSSYIAPQQHEVEQPPIQSVQIETVLKEENQQDSKQELKIHDVSQPFSQKEIVETSDEPAIFQNKEQITVTSSIELSDASKAELAQEQETSIPAAQNFFIDKPVKVLKRNSERKINPAFIPKNENDTDAKKLYLQAKSLPDNEEGNTRALNLLNDALGILDEESNENIKAAIHFERAKIFDDYDYVDYALRDYYEATKASDFNLKANAFYKTGALYDEFSEFNPALDNYLSSVAYSGEADNLNAQSHVLSKIAGLYAKQYDTNSTKSYTDLSIDTAIDSNNPKTIARAYSQGADNLQYVGDNKNALNNYKNALKAFKKEGESYEQMAYNYEQAAIVMEKLGNSLKARKLQEKANLYYQLIQQSQNPQELAS